MAKEIYRKDKERNESDIKKKRQEKQAEVKI